MIIDLSAEKALLRGARVGCVVTRFASGDEGAWLVEAHGAKTALKCWHSAERPLIVTNEAVRRSETLRQLGARPRHGSLSPS